MRLPDPMDQLHKYPSQKSPYNSELMRVLSNVNGRIIWKITLTDGQTGVNAKSDLFAGLVRFICLVLVDTCQDRSSGGIQQYIHVFLSVLYRLEMFLC